MKDFMKKLLVEDWVVTILSIPLLVIAGLATFLPKNALKVPSDLVHSESWLNIGALFIIALVVLYVGNLLLPMSSKLATQKAKASTRSFQKHLQRSRMQHEDCAVKKFSCADTKLSGKWCITMYSLSAVLHFTKTRLLKWQLVKVKHSSQLSHSI